MLAPLCTQTSSPSLYPRIGAGGPTTRPATSGTTAVRSPFAAGALAADAVNPSPSRCSDQPSELDLYQAPLSPQGSASQATQDAKPARGLALAALALTTLSMGLGLAHPSLFPATASLAETQTARLASAGPSAVGLPSSAASPEAAAPAQSEPLLNLQATTAAEDRLASGVQAMVDGTAPTPEYLAGYHPTWTGPSDHCYSIYFRVAIRQGLLNEAQAEAIMARFPVSNELQWLHTMFPQGYQTIPVTLTPNGVELHSGSIPRGQLVSLDSNAHVMMSTGKTLADGHHEVYSFKGGGPETPSWGDSVGYDPAAKVHVTTIEDELQALRIDDQPIANVRVAVGHSVLGLLPATN
jgi:hypothetical protein